MIKIQLNLFYNNCAVCSNEYMGAAKQVVTDSKNDFTTWEFTYGFI